MNEENPIQVAIDIIENVKRKLESAISDISGIEIDVKNIKPALKPRADGDLFIKFALKHGTSADLTQMRQAFTDISKSEAVPRSVIARDSYFTVQMKPNYSKLGL